MKRIISEKLPKAVGPYSAAVVSNNCMYVSGQIAINAQTQEIMSELDVVKQTELICENLKAFYEEQGLSFENVIKTTVLLADMNDFAAVNDVYEKYFVSRPARSAFAVKTLPKNMKVEIESTLEIDDEKHYHGW